MLRIAGCSLIAMGALAGYDALGYQRAAAFERERDGAAPAIARRWSDLVDWHPSLALFWPDLARQARTKKVEWQVKAADIQVANGTAAADLPVRLDGLKDLAPQLAPAIRKIEEAREQSLHDQRWKAVQAEARSLAAIEDPATALAAIDAFLREFPETPRRDEALKLAESLKEELKARRYALDRQFVDDLVRSESMPNASLAGQAERATPVPRRASGQPVASRGPGTAR